MSLKSQKLFEMQQFGFYFRYLRNQKDWLYSEGRNSEIAAAMFSNQTMNEIKTKEQRGAYKGKVNLRCFNPAL
jgi:hypothetical protein